MSSSPGPTAGTKRGDPRFPIGRCGETLYSAPSRRLAGLVSFGKRVSATTQRLSAGSPLGLGREGSVSEISPLSREALAWPSPSEPLRAKPGNPDQPKIDGNSPAPL